LPVLENLYLKICLGVFKGIQTTWSASSCSNKFTLDCSLSVQGFLFRFTKLYSVQWKAVYYLNWGVWDWQGKSFFLTHSPLSVHFWSILFVCKLETTVGSLLFGGFMILSTPSGWQRNDCLINRKAKNDWFSRNSVKREVYFLRIFYLNYSILHKTVKNFREKF